MRALVLSLQVFLLMCTPLPQAAYAAVGLGRGAGLDLGLLFTLYLLSDILVFSATCWLVRRAGLAGVHRLKARLPARIGRTLDASAGHAALESGGWTGPAAVFAAGYANLYLAALITGLRRRSTLTSIVAGIAGDMVQFIAAVALAGALARAMGVPGGSWIALMTAPLVVTSFPGWPKAYRSALAYLRRPRPAFSPVPSALTARALVPVCTDDHCAIHRHG